MNEALVHRGPDYGAVWSAPDQALSLAHRRLSILDLSPSGHQPMSDASERWTLAYNGEIYNHHELRRGLKNPERPFRGHSDTEVLVELIQELGFTEALKKCVGMFAIAAWDRHEQKLWLARDRMGEKPLYFGFIDGDFCFASELKALHQHPRFAKKISRDNLCLYFRHSSFPAPYTVYENIFKLRPGHALGLSRAELESLKIPESRAYWQLTDHLHKHPNMSVAEALVGTERVLLRAVEQQMVADVPLGCFLSGGIDSSLITALMQAQSNKPVKTYSIGFGEAAYNEAPFAKAVAEHLKTEHTEFYVSAEQALAIVPELSRIYDEPFADSSQIPTHLVAKLARQHVTVCLSGDGGDEIFGGYNRYIVTQGLWKKLKLLPTPLRRKIGEKLLESPPEKWDQIFPKIAGFLPRSLQLSQPGDRIHRAARLLSARNADELYLGFVSHWSEPEALVLGGHEPLSLLTEPPARVAELDLVPRMMAFDALTYLPDDILAKVDRAAMAVSLETRIPFLDHRVVEWAWSLPLNMKIREGQGKWILRQILAKHVPVNLFERPKTGFGIPLDQWLRGPLRDWASSLLEPSRLDREGYLNAKLVSQYWEEHLTGRKNWQGLLWDVLMFQSWLAQ